MLSSLRSSLRQACAFLAALALAGSAAASEFQQTLVWAVIPTMLVVGPFIGAFIGWLLSAERSTSEKAAAIVSGAIVVPLIAPTLLFISMNIVDPIEYQWSAWQTERAVRQYSDRPAVRAACAGDVAALKAALTDEAIRDPELKLPALIEMCVFDGKNPHDPRRAAAPEAARAPVPTRAGDVAVTFPAAPERLPVLGPLAGALLRQQALQTQVTKADGDYCSYLQRWHENHHVFILRELHANGLPLDCVDTTRAWWKGLVTKPNDRLRPTRMFLWLGALADLRFDFARPGCAVTPCASARSALDYVIDDRDLPLIRFLLLAGVDPTTPDENRNPPQSAYDIWVSRDAPAGATTAPAASAADARARMLADIDREEDAVARQKREADQARVDAAAAECREKVIRSRNYVIAGHDRCEDVLGFKEYTRLRDAPSGVQLARPKH